MPKEQQAKIILNRDPGEIRRHRLKGIYRTGQLKTIGTGLSPEVKKYS